MSFLSDWVLNIIIFLFLAMIIEMLLPDSDMKKYTKLVIGLLLITIIVTPIFKLLSTDVTEIVENITQSIEREESQTGFLIDSKKREIESKQYAYTLEKMAVQLKNNVDKELMEKYGVEIININISATGTEFSLDNLKNIIVHLTPHNEKVEAVQPVSITLESEENEKDAANVEKIQTLLAEKWEIPETIIEIVLREE